MPRTWQVQECWMSMCWRSHLSGSRKAPQGQKDEGKEELSEERREGKGQRFKPMPRPKQEGTWWRNRDLAKWPVSWRLRWWQEWK